MEPAACNAPAFSALQKRRDYLSIHTGKKMAEAGRHAPHALGARSVFETVPARLSGSTSRKWWVATVLPRALRFKRPLHRCNACNPKDNRDAKAELNHRSQACEVLTGTGVRVAELVKEMESRTGMGFSSLASQRPRRNVRFANRNAPVSAVLQTAA
jgi:hypothetical protein